MSKTSVLAAAALVASQTSSAHWEQQGAHVVVRVVLPTRAFQLHFSISALDTVEDLYRFIECALEEQNDSSLPDFTVVLISEPSISDLGSIRKDKVLSQDLSLANSVVVVVDELGETIRIPHDTLFKGTESWTSSRLATVHSALLRASKDTLLRFITVVSTEERDMLLKWGTALPSDQSNDHGYSSIIHHYFEKIARETPDDVALQWEDHIFVTYGELDHKSNTLAAYLVEDLNVRPGDVVFEFFDKGIEMIVGMLAILKAGAAYVPLDIEHPADRTRAIQELVDAKLCLTTTLLQSDIASRIAADSGVSLLSVDEFFSSPLALSVRPFPSHTATGDDLCYIMFTSGSTGVPKGVMVQHSSVVASVINGPESNQKLRREGKALRTLMFSNYAFDYSVWDIFLTLTSGGCLCIAPKEAMLNDLAAVMNSMAISFLETTPTVLSLLDPTDVPTLTTVYSSGEPLTTAVRDNFTSAAILPGRRGLLLCNGGAPTETTVMSVFTKIRAGDDVRTFGRPFGGNRLYVLDMEGGLCPIGAVGQLWIGGPQVSKGYFGRDDLTLKSYRPDPFHSGGRMYNTGDLCSWADHGVLLYFGRADAQVKIRGQRIETGEIESTLMMMQEVGAASVVKRSYADREELVAFVTFKLAARSLSAIQEFLSSKLPKYMLPSDIISLPALPVTSNGKVDRRALQSLAAHSAPVTTAIAPKYTPINGCSHPKTRSEKVVRSAWASALSIPDISLQEDRDFFEIGGDSISAIRVAAACRASGYALHVTDFKCASTIATQAALLENRTSAGCDPVQIKSYKPFDLLQSDDYRRKVIAEVMAYGYKEGDIQDAYPCTATVAGLISLAVASPLSYFARYAFKSTSVFSPAYMEAAWRLLLERHEILRTAFVVAPHPYNDVVQVILSEPTLDIGWSYQAYTDDVKRDSALENYFKGSEGFALGQVPTRVALFESPGSSVLTWQMHHSQYDGWSFPMILQDLQMAYSICTGSSVTRWSSSLTPYSHFVRWSLAQDTNKALEYWSNQLADTSLPSWPKVPLFNVRKRAVTDQTRIWTWTAGKQLVEFCAAQRVTVSSFLRTAVAILLGMYESSDDVLFGVVTSGRTGSLLGVESISGPCIATLPCRIRLNKDIALSSLLARVHEESIDSTPFQFVGLNEIIRSSTFTDVQDIFRVLLVIENLPGLHENEHTFFGRNLRGHELEMNYPLAIIVFSSSDNSELRIQFQWDSEYLSSADIIWAEGHLSGIFQAMIQTPESTMSPSNFLAPDEEKFLRTMGVGFEPVSSLTIDYFFHQLVDESALRNPSRIAVQHTSGSAIRYDALVCLANQAAHGLQSRGVRPETMVPVLFDKNKDQIEAVVAMLAILKAGGAFVPLDSTWPPDRLMSCIRQAGCKFLVCDSVTPDIAHQLAVPVVTIDTLSCGQPMQAPETPELQSSSLSYVMFTSGSTGQPKGVMLEHSNIVAYIANGSTVFPLENSNRFLHFSPWSFDQGLADLFLTLPKGATLLLANMNEMLMDLSGVLNATRAEYAVLTPAIAQLIQAGIHYPYLKTLVCGGEKLPAQLAHRWVGKLELIDAYGPTEVTVHAISVSFKSSNYVPGVIGRPLGTTRAYVVNSALQLQPVGVTGELLLAGKQVARGYLNLAAESAAAFITDPFHPGQRMYRTGDLARFRSDGAIEYLGRKDGGYIKLRGLRIDVAEIEATLMSVVNTFAVVQLVKLDGREHLLAYLSRKLAPAGEAPLTLPSDFASSHGWMKTLLKTCKRILPSHSIPTLWLVVDAIPQAASNKFDRKQLRRLFDLLASEPGKVEEITRILLASRSPRAPETAVEKELYSVWSQILDREQISVHDDFFSIGGDSIGAIRVLASLRYKGCNLTIKDFYEASTIASLAHLIGTSKVAVLNAPASSEQPLATGLVYQVQKAPSEARDQVPLWLLHCAEGVGHEYMNLLPLGRDVYAISNPSKNRMILEADYPTLDSFTDKYMSLIPPNEEVFLGGYSSGGVLALNIATRRISLGQPVKGVVLFDTFNTAGWKFLGFAPDTDYGSNHLSNAINPGAKELQRAHERHTYHLITSFVEPRLEIPVLLLHAGIRETFRGSEFEVAPGNDDLNFFTMENLPLLEVVTIDGAEHADLVAYKENFATDVVRRVCEAIREFCGRHQ